MKINRNTTIKIEPTTYTYCHKHDSSDSGTVTLYLGGNAESVCIEFNACCIPVVEELLSCLKSLEHSENKKQLARLQAEMAQLLPTCSGD